MSAPAFDLAFVTTMPEALQERVLYVSMEYDTAIHRCACGCGEEVVTPLSPRDWSMTYNGEALTLAPSIGNWRLPCRSHYWIRHSTPVWVPDITASERPEEPASWLETFWDRMRAWLRLPSRSR